MEKTRLLCSRPCFTWASQLAPNSLAPSSTCPATRSRALHPPSPQAAEHTLPHPSAHRSAKGTSQRQTDAAAAFLPAPPPSRTSAHPPPAVAGIPCRRSLLPPFRTTAGGAPLSRPPWPLATRSPQRAPDRAVPLHLCSTACQPVRLRIGSNNTGANKDKCHTETAQTSQPSSVKGTASCA